MNILGYQYQVVENSEDDGYENLGSISQTRLKIVLREGLPQQQKESTLLHEILHGISHHMELDLDEDLVRRLETGLYQVMVTNGVDLTPLLTDLSQKKLGNPK